VKEGDSLFVPAGTVHWYENKGKANAEFLCVVPKKEKYDAVYLEEAVASLRSAKVHARRGLKWGRGSFQLTLP